MSVFPASSGQSVYLFLAVFGLLFGLYYAAFRGAANASGHPAIALLVVGYAVLFRLALIPAGMEPDTELLEGLRQDLRGEEITYRQFLIYDQDVWRFLWEGHVWSLGLSPYSTPPQDPRLDRHADSPSDTAQHWQEIRERVTYPHIGALYPPVAQSLFRLSHWTFPGSVVGWKIWLILLEAGAACWVGMALRHLNKPVWPGLLLFCWNPLSIKVFSGSGHYDALLVLFLSLLAYLVVSNRPRWATVAVALATLTKFVPLVLLPLVPIPLWLGIGGVGGLSGLAYLPVLSEGTAMSSTWSVFAGQWRFNAGPFRVSESIFGSTASLVGYGTLLAALVYWLRGRISTSEERLRGMLWTLGMAIVLGPVVFPWYLTWILPMACILGDRVWLAFTGIVFLAFSVMINGMESTWAVISQYVAFCVVAFLGFKRKDTHSK